MKRNKDDYGPEGAKFRGDNEDGRESDGECDEIPILLLAYTDEFKGAEKKVLCHGHGDVTAWHHTGMYQTPSIKF